MVDALNAKELKVFRALLKEQFGYNEEFPYTVFMHGEAKYSISPRDVEYVLDKRLRIERVGIYIGQVAHGELRLSIEGSQLIGPHATKHVLTLNTAQRDEWMLGHDVELKGDYEQAFYIVTCAEDFLGCGKYKNGTLQNYVPKERYVGAAFTDEDIKTN